MVWREAWQSEAEHWVEWARSPLDAYWQYRDTFFGEIVPAPTGLTVEVGCGEGRVTRDLAARGHRVVALDGSLTLLGFAKALSAEPLFQADAAMLPLASDIADIAVAYNTLQDFDNMPASVAEVSRILRPGASFCICISHPVFDVGRFASDDAELRTRQPTSRRSWVRFARGARCS